MATVEELYQQILGRQADPGGLAYYQNLFGPTIEPEEVQTFLGGAVASGEVQDVGNLQPAATSFISSLQSPVQNINLPAPTPGPDLGPATVNLPTTQPVVQTPTTPSTPIYQPPYTPSTSTPTTERGIVGYDESGSPIYGDVPAKEAGKRFDDAIKDLYWEVLGREPDAAGLEAYKKAFGSKISPQEEQIFYRNAFPELQQRNDPLYNLYAQNLQRAPTLDEYRSTRREFGGDVSAQEEQQFFEQEVLPGLRQSQDPILQLYQQELGRTPDVGGYRYYQEQFGQPTVLTEQMRQQFLTGGGAGGSGEIPSRMGEAFRALMGREPTAAETQELSKNVGTLDQNLLGEYLATRNRASTPRYTASPVAGYIAQNLPSNINPFTVQNNYVPLTRPNVSASMNLAGQQYYQTPTSPGVNYIGAPTNIAPITQGFQPVGQPSIPSFYQQQPFSPMGGKGSYQPPPQSQQQISFQSMGGKGAPRAITGKG